MLRVYTRAAFPACAAIVPRALALAGVAWLTAAAHAQWSYTVLHPAGATDSFAFATDGVQQAGRASFPGAGTVAGFWSGSAGSWVDLAPLTSGVSEALAVAGGQQAGYANFGGGDRAGYWTGTPGSWVNINPALSVWSRVHDTTGTQQVGYATHLVGPGTMQLASKWEGSALTWVNLNPTGAVGSIAEATTGTQQAGGANFGDPIFGPWHAGIWSGSAASWVDLHPAGAGASYAYDTAGTQQAGYVTLAGANRASIWAGTPGSWINLNPAGATESVARGTNGTQQVGWAMLMGSTATHAGIWSGTAASWFDLHTVLSSDYEYSEARSIYTSGGVTYVAGFAHNVTVGRTEAILWTIPEPTSLAALLVATGLLGLRLRSQRGK